MKKVKVENRTIDVISDVVSEVVHSYEDDVRFEGAYINCSRNEQGILSNVSLCLVYIDHTFKMDNFDEELNRCFKDTGINLSVSSEPYWMYGGDGSYLMESALLTGDVIYDRNGNLTELKRVGKIAQGVESKEEISIEVPIQYKKTNK